MALDPVQVRRREQADELDDIREYERPRRRGPGVLGVLGMLVAGLLLGVVMFLILARVAISSTGPIWSHLAAAMLGRSTSIDVSAPAVVERIRKLSRLETVVYSLDKIVEGERQSQILPSFLAGDKLLMVAHGEVIAGVDLSLLKAGDVSIEADTVHIHLPAAQVLSTNLDNSRTKVYSRNTGLIVAADPDLESKVRAAAEQQIGQAAVADGILDKARENARVSVTALLYGLGFKTVVVT